MVKRYGISYRTPEVVGRARMIAKDHGDHVRHEDWQTEHTRRVMAEKDRDALESENTRLQAELREWEELSRLGVWLKYDEDMREPWSYHKDGYSCSGFISAHEAKAVALMSERAQESAK